MPHAKKELPPYKGELQAIKIVKSGDFLGIKPLDYVIDFENARGDFNELSPGDDGFNNLATESGKRFFSLVSH